MVEWNLYQWCKSLTCYCKSEEVLIADLFDGFWHGAITLLEHLWGFRCLSFNGFLLKEYNRKKITAYCLKCQANPYKCNDCNCKHFYMTYDIKDIFTYFLRACWRASDSSSLLASSLNFFRFSFISWFLPNSWRRFSTNSPRKPLRPEAYRT